jgi:hypothetical protein
MELDELNKINLKVRSRMQHSSSANIIQPQKIDEDPYQSMRSIKKIKLSKVTKVVLHRL